ncbi:MAG: YkgJ family cysteine cluster protein, partial [Candidatus Eremiobacteraeota bacterium]|nr:YkgJ family cysteine cluster protein [Candidatus Eremiobacteraeota bacterium]
RARLEKDDPMSAIRAALDAIRSLEQLGLSLQLDFSPQLACRQGCSFCCYPPVSASLPEVLNLVAYLKTQTSPETFQRLRQKVRERAEQTQTMTTAERHRISLACPFLEEGKCSVYAARPLACRGFNSRDAAACEKAFEEPDKPPQIPAFLPLLLAAQAIKDELRQGIESAGLPAELLDLTKAADLVMDDPDGIAAAFVEGRSLGPAAQAFQ